MNLKVTKHSHEKQLVKDTGKALTTDYRVCCIIL